MLHPPIRPLVSACLVCLVPPVSALLVFIPRRKTHSCFVIGPHNHWCGLEQISSGQERSSRGFVNPQIPQEFSSQAKSPLNFCQQILLLDKICDDQHSCVIDLNNTFKQKHLNLNKNIIVNMNVFCAF